MAEFQMLITEIAGINGQDLKCMLSALISEDMETFFRCMILQKLGNLIYAHI